MYVPAGTVPQNSMSPAASTADKVARSRALLYKLGVSVLSARAEYRQIAPPESFIPFGQNLVNDVTWSQNTFNRVGDQPGASCSVADSIANLSSAVVGAGPTLGVGAGSAAGPPAVVPRVVPLNAEITVPELPQPSLQPANITAPWGDWGIGYGPSPVSVAALGSKNLLLGVLAVVALGMLLGGAGAD
jgi:hypothetical protein